jgi:lysophospholipase L1-like esterase
MMIETYVVTRYPSLKVSFTNSGWGGDRVTGGAGGDIDLRLSRDVVPYKPSVITIMLGMNDGGYKAATEASDKAYFDGYRHIYQTLQKDVPGARITAIEPSPYDDVTRPPAFPVQGGIAYNDVMKAYGKWVSNFVIENHLTLADANTDFVHMLGARQHRRSSQRREDPGRSHPSVLRRRADDRRVRSEGVERTPSCGICLHSSRWIEGEICS